MEKNLWKASDIVVPEELFDPVLIVLNDEQKKVNDSFLDLEIDKERNRIRAKIITTYIERENSEIFWKIHNFFIGEHKSLRECLDTLIIEYGVPLRVMAAFRILFNKE